MLTSKVLPENIEDQSEVSGCANSCNVFFQFDLGKPWPMILHKRHRRPLCFLYERAGRRCPVTRPLSGVPRFNSLRRYMKRFKY